MVGTVRTKVLIIALDGLEYTYVNEQNFVYLKQLEYGKVKVPITEIGEASTPIIWVSFVTGKYPSEHGIRKSNVYHSKMVDMIVHWIGAVVPNQIIRKMFITFAPVRRFLKKLEPFHTHMPRKSSIKVPTLFDQISSSISVSVPVLNVDVDVKYVGIIEAIIDPRKRFHYVNFLMSDFEQDKEQLFEVLNRYELVMVHFQLSDLYGHIFCRNMKKIVDLYCMLDSFVGEVLQLVDSKCWVLVVADHGIDKDFGHTNYGFYSSNISLGLENPDITVFYDLIMEKFT